LTFNGSSTANVGDGCATSEPPPWKRYDTISHLHKQWLKLQNMSYK
jgi:hypothetical protein